MQFQSSTYFISVYRLKQLGSSRRGHLKCRRELESQRMEPVNERPKGSKALQSCAICFKLIISGVVVLGQMKVGVIRSDEGKGRQRDVAMSTDRPTKVTHVRITVSLGTASTRLTLISFVMHDSPGRWTERTKKKKKKLQPLELSTACPSHSIRPPLFTLGAR